MLVEQMTLTQTFLTLPSPPLSHSVQAVLKVGVKADGDACKIERDFGLKMEGVVDLSDFARQRLCGCSDTDPPQSWSLAGDIGDGRAA
jgi:hypothetical protein